VKLCIRVIGLDLLSVELTTDSSFPELDDDDRDRDASGGTLSSTPMGFTPSWGDQRREKAPDLE
jgi:hypothetical protein